ncbi:MAG: pilus assembly protein [Alphaproteobacteria bacterium]|nr:pilus assembly protein [Alphaproteobacteria bacterium]
MSLKFMHRQAIGARYYARRLKDNISGIAAVEFGLIAPVMLIMLIGTIEVSRAISIDRRFGLSTSMVGDLVAREEDMSADNLNAIYNIVQHVMSPYDTSQLKIAVIPVKAASDDNTNTKVYAATTNRPSYNGMAAPAACSDYGLTAGLVDEGESVIVVESSYDFTPLLVNDILGARTWTDKSVLSPRTSCVDFDDDNCVSPCF